MRWKVDQSAVWCMCVLRNSNHLYCWALKNWYFQIVVLEKNPENPLDSKEVRPANPKGNQPWIFIGRTDAEAEAPIFWPPDAKSWLIGKDPDTRKDWGQEEKRATEDEMTTWHHQLNGHEFEETLGGGERQGSLTCCRPWDCKELGMTEWLNNTSCLNRSLSSSLFRPFRVGFEEAMSLSLFALLFHWFTE